MGIDVICDHFEAINFQDLQVYRKYKKNYIEAQKFTASTNVPTDYHNR